MVGWHHRLNGHGLEQALGSDEGRGSLRAAVHGVTKSQTRLNNKSNKVLQWIISLISHFSCISVTNFSQLIAVKITYSVILTHFSTLPSNQQCTKCLLPSHQLKVESRFWVFAILTYTDLCTFWCTFFHIIAVRSIIVSVFCEL